MKTIKDYNGNNIDFEAAVMLMDDEIREQLHTKGIEDEFGSNIFKQLSYGQLVKLITDCEWRLNKFNVVSILIGYNGVVTVTDYENILKACEDDLID